MAIKKEEKPMNINRLREVMDAIHALRDERGIEMRGGKVYTMVQDRVEALRRTYGDEIQIVTEIVNDSYEVPLDADAIGVGVIMRCQIIFEGKVLATGHDVEFWGEGFINKTSALENAETSAVGRALAALGVHGGEFASINEIEGVDRKKAATKLPMTKATPITPVESSVDIIESFDVKSFSDQFLAEVNESTDANQVRRVWRKYLAQLETVQNQEPNAYRDILVKVRNIKEELDASGT